MPKSNNYHCNLFCISRIGFVINLLTTLPVLLLDLNIEGKVRDNITYANV